MKEPIVELTEELNKLKKIVSAHRVGITNLEKKVKRQDEEIRNLKSTMQSMMQSMQQRK